ncbi:MAG: PEP-CTERM sorting domain-containing protein [Akkermansiaceae bacterium]
MKTKLLKKWNAVFAVFGLLSCTSSQAALTFSTAGNGNLIINITEDVTYTFSSAGSVDPTAGGAPARVAFVFKDVLASNAATVGVGGTDSSLGISEIPLATIPVGTVVVGTYNANIPTAGVTPRDILISFNIGNSAYGYSLGDTITLSAGSVTTNQAAAPVLAILDSSATDYNTYAVNGNTTAIITDTTTVAAIPEPSSSLLLAVSAGLLLLHRRK